jgi:hypothetical protein
MSLNASTTLTINANLVTVNGTAGAGTQGKITVAVADIDSLKRLTVMDTANVSKANITHAAIGSFLDISFKALAPGDTLFGRIINTSNIPTFRCKLRRYWFYFRNK